MAYAAFNPVGFDWSKGAQTIDGIVYEPVFGPGYASSESTYEQGPLSHYVKYQADKKALGNTYEIYNPSGTLTGNGVFTKDDIGRDGFFEDIFGQATHIAKETAPLWMMALGANYLAPGVAGEAAAAGGASGGGGLLGGGGSALSQAGLSTTLGAPLAELTAGGLLTGSGAPALLSEAAIGAGLTGGLTAAGSAAAPYVMGSADKAAMLGNAGYGPGMSGLQTAAFDGTLGATGSSTLAKLASDAAGSTVGSTLGNLSGQAIGGLLGAVGGAANSGDKTQTSQQRLDPRMEAMLYGADGKGGYLGAATDWFNQNKGGNPLMLQGAQMMADFYRSPQYTEGYNSLRSAGLGLLNTPMAGNPFLRG